jgi:hypothetical protein
MIDIINAEALVTGCKHRQMSIKRIGVAHGIPMEIFGVRKKLNQPLLRSLPAIHLLAA